MKAAVISFPASNCDEDCIFTLKQQGFEVSQLWHKTPTPLDEFDLVVLPGGFSYGDYLRCGAMAAQSAINSDIRKYAQDGGLLLGICNGFQILCEMQLLPGALARNEKLKFICDEVYLKTENTDSVWTREMKKDEVIQLPIAHGDGRYIIDEAGYAAAEKNGQILFRYCTAEGKLSLEGNRNGSLHAIAGICNEKKNVFGMMPHPERATDLKSRHGAKIWNSLISHLREKKS